MNELQELIKSNKEQLINQIYEKELLLDEIQADIDENECHIEILQEQIDDLEEKQEGESEALQLAKKQLNELLSKDFSGYSESQIQKYFFGEDKLTLSMFEDDDVRLDEI
jgi:chromosome segregation ATPase